MNNQSLYFGIIGLFLGAGIVWFAAGSALNNQNYGMMRMMGFGDRAFVAGNPDSVISVIDAHFIERMIPHHEDAITMAKLALEKSGKEEIKKLAENIVKTQTEENEKMRSWYKSWFGTEASELTGRGMGLMGGGMMGDGSDIKELENAENFDKAFIEEMIPHHQMAVMMANMLKNGTQRPEMKQLAEDIITAQTTEIDQMRQWYREWGY